MRGKREQRNEKQGETPKRENEEQKVEGASRTNTTHGLGGRTRLPLTGNNPVCCAGPAHKKLSASGLKKHKEQNKEKWSSLPTSYTGIAKEK